MKKPKKVLCVLMSLMAVCFAAACGNDNGSSSPAAPQQKTETEIVADALADGELSILALGNSFSLDGMDKVYPIAKSLGIENLHLGILSYGGCTLEQHENYLKNDTASYGYSEWSEEEGGWAKSDNVKASTMISSYAWDYIVLQQGSGSSGMSETYSNLTKVANLVRSHNQNAVFVWQMTWAYQGNSTHPEFYKYENDQIKMYNAIVSATQKRVVNNRNIAMIIPSGTAIQNARTSSLGDTLTRDGYHLARSKGRYIAALTFVAKLAGKDISTLTYLCDGVDETTRDIAVQSVQKAIANPFAVSNVNL